MVCTVLAAVKGGRLKDRIKRNCRAEEEVVHGAKVQKVFMEGQLIFGLDLRGE